MAATMLSRLVQNTSRFAVHALRFQTPTVCGSRTFSLTARALDDKRYTEKHEWIEVKGNIGTVGISEFAQESLGEIVYVQLPDVGLEVEKGGDAGCLESVKAASDIYSPVGGKITDVNQKLTEKPNLINSSPLEDGWIFKLEVKDKDELDELMNESAYKKFLESHE